MVRVELEVEQSSSIAKPNDLLGAGCVGGLAYLVGCG